MTKKQMIVEAIETLGPDCSLEAVQRHVKNHWRETVNGPLFYSTRKAMKAARSYTEPPPPDEPLPVQNTPEPARISFSPPVQCVRLALHLREQLGDWENVKAFVQELSQIAH